MSAATLGRLGYAALLLTLLLAVGGAASTPDGILLGVPAVLPALLVALAVGALMGRGPEAGRVALGLGAALLGVGLAGPVSGLRALTGRPLFSVGLAAALLVGSGLAPWRLLARAFLPVVTLAYLTAAYRVQAQVGPEGDEPHYLMVADSLLRDRDLALERDYAEGRYAAFHPKPLAPHYRVRGRGGEVYSLHAIGLSLLVLPAYAAAGYAGASFFMAALAIALAQQIRGLLRETLSEEPWAEGAAWLVALSPPLLSYAGLVFTEVPAALGVAVVLRLGRRPEPPGWGPGLILAALPWLNVRYGVLSVVLALYLVAGRWERRRIVPLLIPALVSALALGLHHFRLYGFFDPRRVYGRRPEFSLATLVEGFPGLLLDQEFGLLVYAPVFALAAVGLASLWRRDRRLAATCVAAAAAVGLTAGTWHMWRGGFNPPARFLVPIVPVLALLLAARLVRGLSAPAAVLAGWGLWLGATGAWEPRLVHRDRDGTAPLLRASSGAEEWTRLLPGFVLEDEDRRVKALIWAAALAAAVPWSGHGTAGGLAAATLGLAAAAGVASWRSQSPATEGRDAVRVVGRPAVALPSFTLSRKACWTPSSLRWGPYYEPHRFPGGAPLGERLRLPAGFYRIELRAEVLDDRPPGMLRLVEASATTLRAVPWERSPEGLAAVFELPVAARDLSLRIEGGGALLLQEVRLQPWARGPV